VVPSRQKMGTAHTHNPVTFWIAILLQFVKTVPSRDWRNLHVAIHASFLSIVSHLVFMQVLIPYLTTKTRNVKATPPTSLLPQNGVELQELSLFTELMMNKWRQEKDLLVGYKSVWTLEQRSD